MSDTFMAVITKLFVDYECVPKKVYGFVNIIDQNSEYRSAFIPQNTIERYKLNPSDLGSYCQIKLSPEPIALGMLPHVAHVFREERLINYKKVGNILLNLEGHLERLQVALPHKIRTNVRDIISDINLCIDQLNMELSHGNSKEQEHGHLGEGREDTD